MKGKPFVLNTHGSLLGYKKYLPPDQQLPYRLYDAATLKTAAKHADAVVVSSKFEYEDAVEFGVDKRKLHVIPMGIDVPARETRNEGPANSPLRILFVGRLARVRRVEFLLQAVKDLRIPYRVTIVGGEEETASLAKPGYLSELKKLCGDLGIADRTQFAGARRPEELKPYYEDADVFVYPSLYENFGQPILEAASYGLPVVSTAVGVARELVRDGETGFIVPGDPAAIRDRIALLAGSGSRLLMGRNIRETVRQNYGWENIVQKYVEIYRSF